MTEIKFLVFTVPPMKFTINMENIKEEYLMTEISSLYPKLREVFEEHENLLSETKEKFRVTGKFKRHKSSEIFVFSFDKPKALSGCTKMRKLLQDVIVRSCSTKFPSVSPDEFQLLYAPFRDPISKVEIGSLHEEIGSLREVNQFLHEEIGSLESMVEVVSDCNSIEAVRAATEVLKKRKRHRSGDNGEKGFKKYEEMLSLSTYPAYEDSFRKDMVQAIVSLGRLHSRDITNVDEFPVQSKYSLFYGHLDTLLGNHITLLVSNPANTVVEDDSITSELPCEFKTRRSNSAPPQALLGAYTYLLMTHADDIIQDQPFSCLVMCVSREGLGQVYQLTIEGCHRCFMRCQHLDRLPVCSSFCLHRKA